MAQNAALGAPIVHGAWSVECTPREGGSQNTCFASQKVATDPAGRQVVLGVIVEPAKGDDPPRISFRMTNKVYEPAGVGIKIDNFLPVMLPFSACDHKVCEARGWLDDTLVQKLRAGRLLRFAFFIDKKNQITYPVSLDGFDAAFAALQDPK